MSWLRAITSAALSSTAKGVFSQGHKLPARMLSNVRHPPALLDRTKNQDRIWAKAIQDTIERTAGTAQKKNPPTPDELWAERSRNASFNLPADPYTGRRLAVPGNGDLGEIFRRLQARLRRNRVIQEVSRQRRHEKKGVKRRRLSSERWRRMFANEVRKKVQLVSTIRRRGAY